METSPIAKPTNRLVCPRKLFHELLVALYSEPSRSLVLVVGHRVDATTREWLARRIEHGDSPPGQGAAHLRIAPGIDRPVAPPALTPQQRASGLEGFIWIGDDTSSDSTVWGYVYPSGTSEPLDELFLPGAGMFMLPLKDPYGEAGLR